MFVLHRCPSRRHPQTLDVTLDAVNASVSLSNVSNKHYYYYYGGRARSTLHCDVVLGQLYILYCCFLDRVVVFDFVIVIVLVHIDRRHNMRIIRAAEEHFCLIEPIYVFEN